MPIKCQTNANQMQIKCQSNANTICGLMKYVKKRKLKILHLNTV